MSSENSTSVGQDPERRTRPRLASKTVEIDVAGTAFRTTEATLQKSPYFRTLLEIEDGAAIFVDRCPVLFAKVLQYLRTNTVYVSSAVALRELQEEFRFFGLDASVIQLPRQQVVTFQFYFMNNSEQQTRKKVKELTDQGWRVTHISTFSSVEKTDSLGVSGCTLVVERCD
mmetsp:Transcript_126545/g.252945  ORF Transcript_126545/g.252945 Transcript_126545/m.252945 type:complete len:171 (+) Transcript_126545:64-576(+)